MIAYKMVLIQDELRTLRKANLALIKRRRAKKTRLQVRGTLTVEDTLTLVVQKDTIVRQSGRRLAKGDKAKITAPTA
jgi:hypothetical protein